MEVQYYLNGFCSLVGAATIALGFYAVIWGQAQENLRVDDNGIGSFKSSSQKVPLLQNMTNKYRTFA